jgi:nicotinate-nucleotide pyrophosphorylase (carboxylating)
MPIEFSEDTGLSAGQNLAHILPPSWREDIPRWFAEDTPSFDWAGFVVGEEDQEAVLWGKSGVRRCVLRARTYRSGGF